MDHSAWEFLAGMTERLKAEVASRTNGNTSDSIVSLISEAEDLMLNRAQARRSLVDLWREKGGNNG